MVPKLRDKAQNTICKREENPANSLGGSCELVCCLLVATWTPVLRALPPSGSPDAMPTAVHMEGVASCRPVCPTSSIMVRPGLW